MPELIAGLIDVFADEPLIGNPLAVVEGADELNEEQMRRIARAFNQAETTFVLESTRADRKLRSFTASGARVFGTGHNALGTWLWLGEDGELGPLTTSQTFYQEIGAGTHRGRSFVGAGTGIIRDSDRGAARHTPAPNDGPVAAGPTDSGYSRTWISGSYSNSISESNVSTIWQGGSAQAKQRHISSTALRARTCPLIKDTSRA